MPTTARSNHSRTSILPWAMPTLLPALAPRRVIIVGGGAAGLACASTILAAGTTDVVLLEASQRIGGRCRTEAIIPGAGACELGATWFHGCQGNPAWHLAKDIGLLPTTADVQKGRERTAHRAAAARRETLRSDGRAVDLKAVHAVREVLGTAVEECEEGLAAQASASVGAHANAAWASARPSLVERHGDAALLTAAWRACVAFQCAVDGCGDLAEQGTAAYSNYDEFDDRMAASHCEVGGFSKAMDSLAAPLRERGALRLGCQVASVRWGGAEGSADVEGSAHAEGEGDGAAAGVEVVCADGSRLSADAVCLALPLPPLRQLHFVPPLPPSKAAALGQVQLGQVEKLYVVFELEPGAPSDASELGGVSLLWVEEEAEAKAEEEAEAKAEAQAQAHAHAEATVEARAPEAATASHWTRGLYSLHRSAHEAQMEECDKEAHMAEETDAARAEEAARRAARRLVLIGWLTGASARAVSGRGGSSLLGELCAGLAPFLERLRPWRPVECHVTSWCADPHFGGSYSFPTPTAPADVADVLAEPLLDARGTLRVSFAGEHTSKRHFATVAGAIESGRREAKLLCV